MSDLITPRAITVLLYVCGGVLLGAGGGILSVFLLHNTQHRYERAQNQRWAALLDRLDITDPVDDEGQQEDA